MGDEVSPLRKAIQQEKAAAQAKADAEAAQRERDSSVATEVPGAWERAKGCLLEAIETANADFEAEDHPNRFKFELLPHPGGNHAVARITHNTSLGLISDTPVVVQRDGKVMVYDGHNMRHLARLPASTISREMWMSLLTEIYTRDRERENGRRGRPPS